MSESFKTSRYEITRNGNWLTITTLKSNFTDVINTQYIVRYKITIGEFIIWTVGGVQQTYTMDSYTLEEFLSFIHRLTLFVAK